MKNLPWTSLLLVFLPAFALLGYIFVFGVNAVLNDEWDIVSYLEAVSEGKLTVFSLFAQHNEDRLFFPRIVMIGLAELTRYNTLAEMIFGWIVLTCTCLVLLYICKRSLSVNSCGRLVLVFLPVSLMLFSFRQFEDILFGFPSVQFYLMIFFVVSSLCLLDLSRKIDSKFALSIVAAFVASFSSIQGLLVWPIAVLQLLGFYGRERVRDALVYGGVGVLVNACYFYDWSKPPQTPALTSFLVHPLQALSYLLVLLGAPFAYTINVAAGFGVLLILLAAAIFCRNYRQKSIRTKKLWVSFIVFGVLSSLITVIGRSGFGIEQALASRYTVVTVLGIIGLYFLSSPTLISIKRFRENMEGCMMLGMMMVGSFISYLGGWLAGQVWKCEMTAAAYVLRNYGTESDANLTPMYNGISPTNAAKLREGAAFLQANQLNVFSEKVPPTPPSIDCTTLALQYKMAVSSYLTALAPFAIVGSVIAVTAIGFFVLYRRKFLTTIQCQRRTLRYLLRIFSSA